MSAPDDAPARPTRVVACDDERGSLDATRLALERAGHEVHAFEDGRQALDWMLNEGGADILVTDVRMPALGGIDLLREVKSRWPGTPVILMTGYADIPASFAAGREGADRYLEKPVDIHDLRQTVHELLERRRGQLRSDEALPGFIGRSPAILELAERVRAVAPTHATVLLTGESGTGKDVVANALHQLSKAKDQKLLALNCAAIPAHLLESELFGHERGAFTGAVARQAGKFELAGSGTLFLDEVGELAPDLQAKFLRVLEERKFMRVGGSAPVEFEARLVAATNRDLGELVAEGRFRQDLYYRLRVVTLDVPPLRQRAGDVSLLAEIFLRRFAQQHGRGSMSFAPDALALLERNAWTGNVRELRNLVESLVVLSRGGTIEPAQLPPAYREPAERPRVTSATPATAPGPQRMEDIEREAILSALRASGGNRDRAARQLGIGLRTLQRKIKEYREQGLDV